MCCTALPVAPADGELPLPPVQAVAVRAVAVIAAAARMVRRRTLLIGTDLSRAGTGWVVGSVGTVDELAGHVRAVDPGLGDLVDRPGERVPVEDDEVGVEPDGDGAAAVLHAVDVGRAGRVPGEGHRQRQGLFGPARRGGPTTRRPAVVRAGPPRP